jgi:signal transduction histidine kinase
MRGLPISLISTLALAAVTILVMWPTVPHSLLIGWSSVFIAVTALRGVLWALTRTTYFERRSITFWRALFVLGCGLSGSSWGVASLLFDPTDPYLSMFMALVIAGTAAGAITSLASDKWAAYALVLPAVLPFALDKLASAHSVDIAVGTITLLFLATLAGSINRLHSQISIIIDTRARLEISQTEVFKLNERMRMATHVARVGIYEWDLVGKKAEWDARVYEIWDLDPSTPATLEAWQSRIHPADLDATLLRFQEVLQSENDYDLEFRVLSREGVATDIRSRGRIERDAAGHPLRMIGLVMDITELRRLDRLKQEFVSMVSHELRTPLTSIRGALLMLASAEGQLSAPRNRQLLDLANRNAERLARLIDDILDMDKIEYGRMRFDMATHDLQELLIQAIATNTPYAENLTVNLNLQPAPAAISVHVDASRLIQVVTNLLSNAAKFSSPGQTVQVSTEVRDKTVRVAVRDQGPGIPAEFQSKIFGKFCQGDSSDSRNRGGSGLGLAISKAIVEAMQGSINFATVAGAGTTFYFDLPLVEQGSQSADQGTKTLAITLDSSGAGAKSKAV